MRYLRSSCVAGLVFCVFAPGVVHFALPPEVVDEFAAVMQRVEGSPPVASDEGLNWLHVAMVFALRLAFGFLAMALFAAIRRRATFLRAACGAGLTVFALTYAPLLAWFHLGHGLPVRHALLGAGIGVVEALLATLLGGLAAGPREIS